MSVLPLLLLPLPLLLADVLLVAAILLFVYCLFSAHMLPLLQLMPPLPVFLLLVRVRLWLWLWLWLWRVLARVAACGSGKCAGVAPVMRQEWASL